MTAKRGTSADAEAPCIFSTLYNRDWAPYATVAAPGLETSWLSGGGFERQIRPRLPQAPASLGPSAAWAALASTQAPVSTWLHLARGERRVPRSCTACTPRSGSPPHRRPGPTQHRRPESLRRSPRRRCRAWRPEQQTVLFPGGSAPPFRVHREVSRPAPALMDAGETGRRWAKRRPGTAGQERQSSSSACRRSEQSEPIGAPSWRTGGSADHDVARRARSGDRAVAACRRRAPGSVSA